MSGFDPAAHPGLVTLGGDLRQLAGDAAYRAGLEYLRKGLVAQGSVAGTTAYATVSGSTNYRVSVSFGDAAKVTCTCPAHRRSKFCKHVVAVCAALLEQPAAFVEVEPAAEPPPQERPRAKRAARSRGPSVEELRAAGLATVDKLIDDLASEGLLGLGSDKVALLDSAAELVRALKLRRLGNLVFALQRAASARGQHLEADAFADLLIDLYLTQRASAAHLTGQAELEPQLAEDLIGKTWRAEELEAMSAPIETMEVAFTVESDGEFRIETSYLAELGTGTVYERSAPKPRYRSRTILEETRLYPGAPPRRVRVGRARQVDLQAKHVDGLVARAETTVEELRRRVAEREAIPFGAPPVVALFSPAALLVRDGTLAASGDGTELLVLDWPAHSRGEMMGLLPSDGRFALFGHVRLGRSGLEMACLSAVSSGLQWGRGPVFPET
jgi:hypothetical protein